jgi:hypothetical protein
MGLSKSVGCACGMIIPYSHFRFFPEGKVARSENLDLEAVQTFG